MILSKEYLLLFGLIYFVLVIVPVSCLLGWAAGKVCKLWIPQENHSPSLLDCVIGLVGFIGAFGLSLIGYSEREEWAGGKLVYREVTGWGDYAFVLGAVGAILLVCCWYLLRPILQARHAVR